MNQKEAEFNDRFQGWLGTGMMVTASAFAVMIFSDRMEMKFLPMPDIWYSTRSYHLFICGVMFLLAAILLKSPLPRDEKRPGQPLFQSCRLMTRSNCGLCEEALTTLLKFQDSLPTIDVVDIDDEPQLVRQFGESVPVVELDGKVRFRGAVSAPLLARLIEAALVRAERQPQPDSDSGLFDSGISVGPSDRATS